mmetsp:Transcript_22622/g.44403  ORF Transcript_22622/g.44403 Transcript_22622/m.44403 type:complete len:121 (-) Transcript_22622:1338-1700(-)
MGVESLHAGMTKEEVLSWFAAKLDRKPTSADIFSIAKDLYNTGDYARAVRALEVYREVPGKGLAGIHLLGYAYYMNGDLLRALETFKSCVNDGFDADWQLLVEIQLELEADRGETFDFLA